jgi:iron uptake system component EfeO
VAVAVTLSIATLSACSSHHSTASQATIPIDVSVGQCGTGWAHPQPGAEHFVLRNRDTRAGEVMLTDAASGAVYADVEPLAPGTATDLEIQLGSGRYAFRCAMEDESTVTGPTVQVPGHIPPATTPVAAISQADLIPATKQYEAYVRGQLPALIRLTDALGRDVTAGNLAAARRDWLPAHLAYERLGAAYDAFGDLDGTINGTAAGLPGGMHDPDWTGFHRVEYGLWHGEDAATLGPATHALVAAVDALPHDFAGAQIDPLDISIRAHEISENALQFELTGQTDYGSHTNLATARANLDGTARVLAIIEPLLRDRYRSLPDVLRTLDRSKTDLDALGPGGRWPAITALGGPARERIDADFSELCELLAPIASILEPRRPQ